MAGFGALKSWTRNLASTARDGLDIARRARSVGALADAIIPSRQQPIILNDGAGGATDADADELIRRLRTLRNQLKGAALSDGSVDYAQLRDSELFDELQATSRLLTSLKPAQLSSDSERIAFFINLYNVLAIHGVVALDIHDSVMELPAFFSTVSYRVGRTVLSLDAIENGVLRRNGAHPATGKPLFSRHAPELEWCPSQVDPRIHAALVCASRSCPPVGFYDSERLDAQLDLASAGYVASEIRADDEARTLHLPITFRYYADDFGTSIEGARDFALEHSSAAERTRLQRAFDEGYDIRYGRYDWSLNHVV